MPIQSAVNALLTISLIVGLLPLATANEATWHIPPELLNDEDDENWPITSDTSGLTRRTDIVFASPNGHDLTLDLYEPANRGKEALPCIVAIHGGAWRVNEKEWFGPHAVYLARLGYVSVTINYRKLPDFGIQECVEDAKSAIRWVRKNAQKLGVDPKRIGALGGSAGGHLVAVLATTDDPTCRVDVAVAFAAGDLGHPGLEEFYEWAGLTQEQAKSLGAYPNIQNNSSPLMLVHGADDDVVPVQVSEDLHARYQERSAPSKLVILPKYEHVFYVTPKTFFESMGYAGSFFAEHFDGFDIVDTHIHLYDTTRSQGVPWPPKSDQVLYRPILPKDFDRIARENGVTAAVVVEASNRLDDNRWILQLAKENPERLVGFVGSLPFGDDEFEKHLEELSQDPRFVGLRLSQRPDGKEFFNAEVWRDLELLAQQDKTLDVLMFDFSLHDVATIAERLPKLKIVMNHVANATIDGQAPDIEWAEAMHHAAQHANVYCKVSGLFQQAERRPAPDDVDFYRPVLDIVTEAFGEDRIIYGSNWPVTMRGGEYSTYKQVVMDYYRPRGRAVVEKLLYKNAVKFYSLRHFRASD